MKIFVGGKKKKKKKKYFSHFCSKHRLCVHVRITSETCSNEYPQCMFWIKNKKNCIPLKPQFYYIKVRFKGVYISWTHFPEEM